MVALFRGFLLKILKLLGELLFSLSLHNFNRLSEELMVIPGIFVMRLLVISDDVVFKPFHLNREK